MDSDEFEAYRQLWKSIDLTRFNKEEQYWYIPLADAVRFLEDSQEGVALLQPTKTQ